MRHESRPAPPRNPDAFADSLNHLGDSLGVCAFEICAGPIDLLVSLEVLRKVIRQKRKEYSLSARLQKQHIGTELGRAGGPRGR